MKDGDMNTYRIATIPGDGIGKQVVPAQHGDLSRSL
jgi:isocitrate/isopropylmalate dehydrogenase